MTRTYFYISAAVMVLLLNAKSFAFAQDTLVIMGIKTSGNQEMLSALEASCPTNAKVINLATTTDVNIPQLVKSSRARVVVALGDQAFKLVNSNLRSTPVIGAFTVDQRSNTMSYLAPAERYLSAMKKFNRKNIAVVYSSNTASYVRNAADLAKGFGINLIRYESSSPAEALEHLAQATTADAIWMIPDSKILTSGTAEIMLQTSLQRSLPVFTFAKGYLKNGAAYAIEVDREKVGKLVGNEVCAVLNSNGNVDFTDADPYGEYLNDSVIDRLRLRKNKSAH